MNLLPLELELTVERLRRHLEANPDDAKRLAIAHFEDFSVLAIEFKKLKMENVRLRAAKTHRDVSLPFSSNRGLS